jgi:hypothetical protein
VNNNGTIFPNNGEQVFSVTGRLDMHARGDQIIKSVSSQRGNVQVNNAVIREVAHAQRSRGRGHPGDPYSSGR